MKKEKEVKRLTFIGLRVVKAAIAFLIWLFSLFPIGLYIHWSIPYEKWFKGFWSRESITIVGGIFIFIVGYLIIYFGVSLFIWLTITTHNKQAHKTKTWEQCLTFFEKAQWILSVGPLFLLSNLNLWYN